MDNKTFKRRTTFGRAIATASGAAWIGVIVGALSILGSARSQVVSLPWSDPRTWFLATAMIVIIASAYLAPAFALTDLQARLPTDTGRGRTWRRLIVFLQFWGVWAYWLFGSKRLPAHDAARIERL